MTVTVRTVSIYVAVLARRQVCCRSLPIANAATLTWSHEKNTVMIAWNVFSHLVVTHNLVMLSHTSPTYISQQKGAGQVVEPPPEHSTITKVNTKVRGRPEHKWRCC